MFIDALEDRFDLNMYLLHRLNVLFNVLHLSLLLQEAPSRVNRRKIGRMLILPILGSGPLFPSLIHRYILPIEG